MVSDGALAVLLYPQDEFISKQAERLRFAKRVLEKAQDNINDSKTAHELISIALFTLKQIYDDLSYLEVR